MHKCRTMLELKKSCAKHQRVKRVHTAMLLTYLEVASSFSLRTLMSRRTRKADADVHSGFSQRARTTLCAECMCVLRRAHVRLHGAASRKSRIMSPHPEFSMIPHVPIIRTDCRWIGGYGYSQNSLQ